MKKIPSFLRWLSPRFRLITPPFLPRRRPHTSWNSSARPWLNAGKRHYFRQECAFWSISPPVNLSFIRMTPAPLDEEFSPLIVPLSDGFCEQDCGCLGTHPTSNGKWLVYYIEIRPNIRSTNCDLMSYCHQSQSRLECLLGVHIRCFSPFSNRDDLEILNRTLSFENIVEKEVLEKFLFDVIEVLEEFSCVFSLV